MDDLQQWFQYGLTMTAVNSETKNKWMNKKLRLHFFFFFTNHQKTPLQKCYSLQGWGRGDWLLRLSLCVTGSRVLTDGFTENACGRTPDANQASRDVIHVTHATGRAIGPGEQIHQPRKCYPVRIAQRHPGDSSWNRSVCKSNKTTASFFL